MDIHMWKSMCTLFIFWFKDIFHEIFIASITDILFPEPSASFFSANFRDDSRKYPLKKQLYWVFFGCI